MIFNYQNLPYEKRKTCSHDKEQTKTIDVLGAICACEITYTCTCIFVQTKEKLCCIVDGSLTKSKENKQNGGVCGDYNKPFKRIVLAARPCARASHEAVL